jgi:hypothetical protein
LVVLAPQVAKPQTTPAPNGLETDFGASRDDYVVNLHSHFGAIRVVVHERCL